MKLSSIALAGLLGVGMVMTSGCEKDDVIPRVASVSVINNDIGTTSISMTVDGNSKDVTYQSNSATTFITTTTDATVSISMPGQSAINVSSEGTHIVGINTACDSKISSVYVKDTLDSNKIRVMNLTTYDLVGMVVVKRNGVDINVPQAIGACKVVSAYPQSLDGNWTVEIKNNLVGVTIEADKLPMDGIEVIIYDITSGQEKGTVLPLL